MSTLLTRVIYIFVAFAIVTAIGFSIPALVQNSTTVMADEEDEGSDDDFDDAEVRCPCQLTEYFKLQTKFAKGFGIFDKDGLFCAAGGGAFPSNTIFAHSDIFTGFGCSYRIFASDDPSRGGNVCRAILFNAPSNCPFSVAYAIFELSDEELAACREEIIRVAGSFEVPCD